MILIIEKKTGFVAMRSDGPITFDHARFEAVEFVPTAEERDRMEQNWHNWWKDGQLVQEPSPSARKEFDRLERQNVIDSVKSVVANKALSNAEIVSAINQLISLVEK